MKTLSTRKCSGLRALHFATIALIATHALFAQQPGPQLQPKVEARALALTPLAARLTDDSLLSSAIRLKPELRKLDLGSLAQRRVKLGDQQEASLDEVTRKVFADNDSIAQSARALAGRGLVAQPSMVREVIEADDSYVLIQATTLDVKDPAEVGRGVPAFADFMSLRPAVQVKLADLSDAERAGLDDYVQNEMPKLDPTHPLAQASKQGPEAVLKAIAEGKGEFEIIDTIVVPKSPLAMRNGELLHPDFIEGMPNFANSRLLPRSILKPVGGSEPAASGPPVERPSVRSDGSVNFKTEFLAGFTKGSSWHWERRWRYPSGFFRITLGASYGLGFRAPILVQGVTAPHRVEVRDNHDHPFDLLSKVSASTRNMNADFYRAAGLPESKVFEGKELVCEFQFLYGYKLRAFWTDILHKKWTTIGFDHGDNLDPPFGGRAVSKDVVIPASLTRTEFDFAVLKGKAEAGLRFTGHGSVNLDYEPLWGGRPVLKKSIRFTDGSDHELGCTMPTLSAAQGETAKQEFGMRLSKPSYDLSLSVTPEIRIGLRAGYKSFSRSFSTGWILLNDLKINLGSVTLGRHEGTRSEYVWNGGVKTFTSINTGADPIAGEGSTILPRNGTTVGLRSIVNHRWVRAGLGEQSLLAATSEQLRGWEEFEFIRLNARQIALRSIQSGRYVRAGVTDRTLLAAASAQKGVWETFDLTVLGNNRVALRSTANGMFVRTGVTDQSLLAALSERIGGWETFEVVAVPAATPPPPPARTAPNTAVPPRPAPRVPVTPSKPVTPAGGVDSPLVRKPVTLVPDAKAGNKPGVVLKPGKPNTGTKSNGVIQVAPEIPAAKKKPPTIP